MTAPASFIHLHVHSAYSLSEGAIKADKLAALALDNGMPAVALTDSANMFGALEFAEACAKKGIQPIMGCRLFLTRAETDPDRPEAARAAPRPAGGAGDGRDRARQPPAPVLARLPAG